MSKHIYILHTDKFVELKLCLDGNVFFVQKFNGDGNDHLLIAGCQMTAFLSQVVKWQRFCMYCIQASPWCVVWLFRNGYMIDYLNKTSAAQLE